MGALKNLWSTILGDIKGEADVHALAEDMLRMIGLVPLSFSCGMQPVSETVTASDASETGGKVCVSTSLTALGREQLKEAEDLRSNPPDAVGGISAAHRALGIAPGTHVSYETDPFAQLVVRECGGF